MNFPSSRCPECPLFQRLRFHVPADGPRNAKMVFVGEAPGENEAKKKKPFVGKAGEVLMYLLKLAGLRREDVLLTNVLKCHPKDNKLPNELDLAIECCSEILHKDAESAEVIVGLGSVPLRAFTGLDRITARRGSVYELEDGRPYVATLHPSFLMRSQFVETTAEAKVIPKEVVVADIKRAKEIAGGTPWKVRENYILYPTQDDLNAFMDRLWNPREGEFCTIDLEAPKVRPRDAIPIIVSWTLDDVTICTEFEADLLFAKDALASPMPKAFQNGLYDVMVFEGLGLVVNNWDYDTNYIHHLLYAELSHKLEFIQSLHCMLPYHKDMRSRIEVFNPEMEESWDK